MEKELQQKLKKYRKEPKTIWTSVSLEKRQLAVLKKGYKLNDIIRWYFKKKGVL